MSTTDWIDSCASDDPRQSIRTARAWTGLRALSPFMTSRVGYLCDGVMDLQWGAAQRRPVNAKIVKKKKKVVIVTIIRINL
ncbi:unnamed protein product [Leptidea sinapis]|uniref:Uncharacterized protein n=1 Tax=Leptidea sinapis TaxID=189913 RepID=A0A5E4PVI0_9NEOP|nr:unnamed protein product [Leptidea sinapis]